jgi:hypothetical protein
MLAPVIKHERIVKTKRSRREGNGPATITLRLHRAAACDASTHPVTPHGRTVYPRHVLAACQHRPHGAEPAIPLLLVPGRARKFAASRERQHPQEMNMQTLTRSCAAAVLAIVWQLPGPAAHAQNQSAAPSQTPSASPSQSPTTGSSQPSAKIPDQKLDAAAAAMQRVAKLQEDFQQQMERVAAEAKDAAQKAVAEQGLSLDEYASILETAQKDPDVREKLLARINPAGGGDKNPADKANK